MKHLLQHGPLQENLPERSKNHLQSTFEAKANAEAKRQQKLISFVVLIKHFRIEINGKVSQFQHLVCFIWNKIWGLLDLLIIPLFCFSLMGCA